MNNDLISKKSLIEAMEKAEAHGLALGDEQSVMAAAAIAGMREYIVQKVPAVNAVEVVHGRWIIPTIINGRSFQIPHCSVCNEVPCGVSKNTKYCAICGAKMDLEDTKDG